MPFEKPLYAPIETQIDWAFYPRVPDISLELTNHCNMRCPYCANRTLTRRKGHIAWELLEKIVFEAGEKKLNISHLHGVGEPLIWNRLEDAIRLIRSHGAGEGSFGTNGSLMTRERAASLLDAGLTGIYFSVDTLDPVIYKKTRGGDLAQVVANIRDFIAFVPPAFPIIIALMNHKEQQLNQQSIDAFHELFGQRDNVKLNFVENAFFPSAPKDYRRSPERIRSCVAPNNYLFVDLEGNAAVCCLDQDLLHCLGNVAERSITDIWFDPSNQTRFRNLALGVLDVPRSCVKRCIMLPPRQDHGVALLGCALPFDEALRLARILLINNEAEEAERIVSCLNLRDPRHPELAGLLAAAAARRQG